MAAGRALITGARGQDGLYLTELLLENGFSVVGVEKQDRLAQADVPTGHPRVDLRSVDLVNTSAVRDLVSDVHPTHIFHLASSSFVPASWDDPIGTSAFTVESATQLLEAIRCLDPAIRYVGAASAEIFGHPTVSPQDELTPVRPLTPYGAAKAHAHFLTQMYRVRYGLHCSSAILYNHESPRRPPAFLPRKVSQGAASIKLGQQSELKLGSLDARRDWSYAGDVVLALFLMATGDEPGDYVIATGEDHSVRDLVRIAFAHVGLDYEEFVQTDPSLFRAGGDAPLLVGDSSRARRLLGWEPAVRFEELVAMMVDADLELLTGGEHGLVG